MKKLLSITAIAVMFVACGNDSPDVVVKKCMSAVYKFDAKQLLDCSYYKTEDERNRASKKIMEQLERQKKDLAKMNKKIEDIDVSIETSIINELENVAKVKAILTMKMDGKEEKFESTENLIKKDNKWYMEKLF